MTGAAAADVRRRAVANRREPGHTAQRRPAAGVWPDQPMGGT